MAETRIHPPAVRLLTCDRQPLGNYWTRLRFSAPYWRLYWNARPGAAVSFGGREAALGPSRLVLIPPETDFRATCAGAPDHLFVHFLADSPFDAVGPGLYAVRATGVVREMAERLRTIAAEDSLERTMKAMALVHLALCHVPAMALRCEPADPRITQALRLMESRLGEPLSNAEIAGQIAMSTNAFIRMFRRAMNVSPQQYCTRKRIEQACMHLHFSEMKLEQIAELAGFCDRYHFSRTFKRLRGIGPAAFRRQRAHSKASR